MSRVNRVALLLVVVLVLVVVVGSGYTHVVRYQEEVVTDEQRVVTHAQAMAECESLGLVYDYELEGTTPAEYCIRAELWNAQQEAQDD